MAALNPVTDIAIESRIAVITTDSPPVNALSFPVRAGLQAGLRQALVDTSITAIVLICAGRTFYAGADIAEFEKTVVQPDLRVLGAMLDASSKPVVAALHGTALGGGFEIALACHFRVAVPSARLGLPEVTLGLLPAAGGTQRLPRLIGAEAALDFIVSGRPFGARQGVELGVIDALVEEGRLRPAAIEFAQQVVAEQRPLIRLRDLDHKISPARANPGLFEEFGMRNARSFRGFRAPASIVRAVEAAVTLPFDEGMQRESELFLDLLDSPESAAQRYQFFAERAASKIPDVPAETPTRAIARVGVIGAGTMGGGIAMNFLNIGLPVTIVDAQPDALDRGVAVIRRNYETTLRKGRLVAEEVERRMSLLTPTLELGSLGDCDLVIEAVYENLDLKKEVFRRLDETAKPEAILASNTSFLDIDAIASVTSRPEQVVGMHFFSPANVMRLLEVVRGARSAKDVIATAMQVGRKIGKVAVLSRVCHGFIANRMMEPRSRLAMGLLLEGPMPWEIDRVITEYGFPMGPFAMADLVGLDVIGWDPKTSASASVLEVLCEMGRWGQKKGGGFYDYDGHRNASPSPVAERVIRDFAARRGMVARTFTDQDILKRLLYPVVNEGAKILEEGVAIRASDLDLALVAGYGWPVYRGGPMFWADTVGLGRIVARLDEMAERDGNQLRPAGLLRRLADDGGALHKL